MVVARGIGNVEGQMRGVRGSLFGEVMADELQAICDFHHLLFKSGCLFGARPLRASKWSVNHSSAFFAANGKHIPTASTFCSLSISLMYSRNKFIFHPTCFYDGARP